ncbi:uncharacterized protein LOC119660236 isoform X2 [Hermetia illucens]|nr:uncharacterized protein LOC119660236 isoform X2 [Hermetia illucens]
MRSSTIAEDFQFGQRGRTMSNDKNKMAPVANHRNSISISEILDKTDPDKLVQLIRQKRGIRNTQRIFLDLESDSNKSNRQSFPIKVQRNIKETDAPVPVAAEPDNICPADENTPSLANSKHSLSQNVNSEKGNDVSDKNRSTRIPRPRIQLRRLSQNLGRRVLLKTFEKTQQNENFCPTVASTPNQRVAPPLVYDSDISQIAGSPSIVSVENISQNDDQTLTNKRKTETVKHAKTITESLISRESRKSDAIQLTGKDQHDAGIHTQVYDESIEVDETCVGDKSHQRRLTRINNNRRTTHGDHLVDETPANLNVACSQNVQSSLQMQDQSMHPISMESKQTQIASQYLQRSNHAINSSANTLHSRHTENTNPPPQVSTSHVSLTSNLAEVSANLVSAIVNGIRRSQNNSVLAQKTPIRTQQTPQKPNDASFTIPPTQTPQMRHQSPVIVIPVYPPSSCNQTPSKTATTHSAPTSVPEQNHLRAGSQPQKPLPSDPPALPADSVALPSDSAQISSNNSKSRLSLKRQKNNSKIHSRKTLGDTIAEMTSDEDPAPVNSHSTRLSVPKEIEMEVTSDESDDGNRLQEKGVDRSNVDPPSRSIRSSIAHQSRPIDLRVSTRRISNRRTSARSEAPHTESVHHDTETSQPRKSKSMNSDSTDINFDSIFAIDRLLKRLDRSSNASRLDGIEERPQQESAENMEPMQWNPSPQVDEGVLDTFNEDIIDHVPPEEAGHGGYIHDLSPAMGKLWINAMLKTRKTGSMARSKRGHRVISKKMVHSPPPAITYNDIESSFQRRKKSQVRNPSLSRNRRKLYSKGYSENENSSEDESHYHEDITHSDNSTAITNKCIYDRESKCSKSRAPAVTTKIQTIENTIKTWHRMKSAQEKQRKSAGLDKNDDDDHLFKIPQAPAPVRKKSSVNVHLKRQERIHNNLSHRNRTQNQSRSRKSSSSSSDESTQSKESQTNHNRSMSKTNDNRRLSNHRHATPQHEDIHRLQSDYRKSHYEESSAGSSPRNSSHLNSSKKQTQRDQSRMSVIQEVSLPDSRNDHSRSHSERPVEPDLTSKFLEKSTNTSASRRGRSSIHKQKQDQVFPSNEIHPLEDTENRHSMQQKSHRKSKNSSEIISAISPVRGEQVQQALTTDEPVFKTPTNTKKSSAKRKVRKGNTDDNETTKTPSQSDRSAVKKKPKKDRDNSSAMKEKTSGVESDASSTTSLRRSVRKRQPPQPYWTSQQYQYEAEISYKDPVILKKQQKVSTKKRNPKKKVLESIAEYPSSPQLPDQGHQVQEANQKAQDLFDALKEMSINTQTNVPSKSSSKPRTQRVRKVPPTPSENYVSESDAAVNTDSGLDTNNEQNTTTFLPTWLRNLAEQKISSDPDLIKIFRLSEATVVRANNLKFRELDGVEYAYYDTGVENLYGYIRFQPGTRKKRSKTKHFELCLLSILGVMKVAINDRETTLENGDMMIVPKGTTYGIANTSDELAMLFFIKR